MGDRAKIEEQTKYVVDLPGFKRTNPHYFSDPIIDKLMDALLMMGGEIWTLRHRQAITEKLMASGEAVSPDMIETYKPDEAFREAMEAERQDLIRRMFSSLAEGGFPDPRTPGFKWVTDPEGEDQPAKGAPSAADRS